MKLPNRFLLSACSTTLLLVCSLFLFRGVVLAADGSGTNTVSPTSVIRNSTGNTLTFTFTAAELMDSGGIGIAAPAGWSAPQGTAGLAGYTTANSTGTIADVRNNLDSSANWLSSNHMVLSIDSGDKQKGTGSLVNTISSTAAANEQWYFNYGAASNWGDANAINLRVGMFLKSDVALAAGNLSWQDDDSASLASPLDTISIPALTANSWHYTSVTLGAATRTSVLSYGFRYTTDIGAAAIKADSISPLFDAADSLTSWKSDKNITRSLLNTAGNYLEGSASIRCSYAANAGIGNAGQCYSNNGNFVIGPGSKVSFWIRSSVALNAGDFVWKDDDSADFGSPLDMVNIPALAANTWTYVVLSAPNSSNITQKSYGLERIVNTGAVNIDIDAIGKQIDNCDAISNWIAPSGNAMVLSTSATTKHEGSGSLQNNISSYAVNGDYWYENLASAADWSGYATVGFWINSSLAAAFGDIQFQYSGSGGLAGPIASLNLGALSANTWTYQKLALSGTRTSVSSYGFKYNTNIGARTVWVDDVLLGPGRPTFNGQTINVRTLALTNPQTITVVYGAGGGASGATATSTIGNSVFTTQSRISDSGSLTNIVSSPTVLVTDVASVFTLNSPGPITAGKRAAYTVTRKDSFGNLVTIGTTTVNLSSSSTSPNKAFYDAASGGNIITSVTVPNGSSTANFWYYDDLAGTWTITASQTGFASGTDNLTVNPGIDAALFLNHPGTMAAGTRAAYTVTRKDQYGNPTISGTISVSLSSNSDSLNKQFYDSSSGGNIITSVNINAGNSTANFWYYDDKPGTWTITVSSGSLISANDLITVVSASTSQFFLNSPGPITAGTRAAYTVSRKDVFGNPVLSGPQIVYLYSSSTSPNKSFYDAASGGNIITSVTISNGSSTANFWYYDDLAGTWTITASDNAIAPDGSTGIIDATDSLVVSSAPTVAIKFVIVAPISGPVGTPVSVTVEARKADGSIDNSYNASVTLNVSGSATGGGLVNIVNGSGTKDISDNVAETVDLSLTDSASTGLDVSSTASVAFSPGPATKFLLNNPGNMSAGTRLGYTVTRQDQYNNPVLSGPQIVYLYSSSTSPNKSFYDAASGGNIITSVTISNGSSTANFWYYDDLAGTWTITASDNAIAPDGSTGIIDATQTVTVSSVPITPTKFAMAASSNSVQIGSPVTITILAVDNSGNLAATYNASVTLNVFGSATGGGLVNIVNGSGTKDISDNVAETVDLSLTDSAATGLDISATLTVNFTVAPPPPPPAAPAPVSAPPFRADIIFSGQAFPGAKAAIIVLDNNNVASVLTQTTVANATGRFTLRYNDITKAGFYAFALTVADKNGNSVQTQSYRFDLVGALFEKSILVSPTISLLREVMTKGDFLTIQGYASPGSSIQLQVDGGSAIGTGVTADATGSYRALFNTAALDFGPHFVRTKQVAVDGRESEYSPQKTFTVSRLLAPQTDLNGDGVIDARDLSIFLSLWSSTDQNARKKIDFNNDGVVDLKDFSIFMRTLSP